MALIEETVIEFGDNYKTVIALDEYNGTISLTVYQEGKDKKLYPKWCYPQAFRDGKRCASEKSRPLSIPLGDKQQALERLSFLLDALENAGNNVTPMRKKERAPF